MSGALTELAAAGEQSQVDPTGAHVFKPEWTKSPHFARAPRVVPLEGRPDFGARAVVEVPREGDLLHRLYLRVHLPELRATETSGGVRWARHPGHSLLRSVTLYVGEQKVVRHTGEYLAVYADLRDGGTPKMRLIGEGLGLGEFRAAHDPLTLYVPLKFFFCEHLCNSLPVVALRYHRVSLAVEFREFRGMYQTEVPGEALPEAHLDFAELVCDWVYLGAAERRSVVERPHRMLLTQLQTQEVHVTGEVSVPLRFFHAVREVMWTLQLRENAEANRHLHFNATLASGPVLEEYGGEPVEVAGGWQVRRGGRTFARRMRSDTEPPGEPGLWFLEPGADAWVQPAAGAVPPGTLVSAGGAVFGNDPEDTRWHLLKEARLLVNGHERTPWLDATYFYLVANYQAHNDYSDLLVYLFSFAIAPLAREPTGALEFSQLDEVTLQIRPDPKYVHAGSPALLRVYGVSQNELEVRRGMAALRYAS